MPELTKDRVRFVRLSAFEDQLLQSVMAHERVNISDALRLGIREAAKSRGLWPENGERDTDADKEAAA